MGLQRPIKTDFEHALGGMIDNSTLVLHGLQMKCIFTYLQSTSLSKFCAIYAAMAAARRTHRQTTNNRVQIGQLYPTSNASSCHNAIVYEGHVEKLRKVLGESWELEPCCA